MSVQDFNGKKVLLTSFSTAKTSESLALCAYLKSHGFTDITTLFWGGEKIAKDIPDDIGKIEINSPRDIQNIDKKPYDIVFRHPSVPPSSVADAKEVMTSTQLFFSECRVPIIGVTGTKGKGTTSALIASMLQSAGIKNWLLGNVGTPALSALEDIQSFSASDAIVVFEISSFQLWDLKKSPETAVVLMVEPDHLDVHANLDEYVDAKANITRYQSKNDSLIFHPQNTLSQKIANSSPIIDKKKFLTPQGAYVRGNDIVIQDHVVCAVKEVALLGEHNLENICAAITAAWKYTHNIEAIAIAIKSFKGLEHRLEEVRKLNGVTFYNDSFSSAPGATIAAAKSFAAPEIIIMGGHDKGGDYSELANNLVHIQNIKKVFIIGENRQKIAHEFDAVNFSQYVLIDSTDFKKIITTAYNAAEEGDIVLLSPASASFGMFKNFYERGAMFKHIVSEL